MADSIPDTAPPSLLEALVFLTGFYGHARSADALVAGLPVEKGSMTPKFFAAAAERAGFRARILRRSLADIPQEVMPAVCVLKSREAVIILQRNDKGALKTLNPATRAEKVLAAKDLEKQSSGYVIFVRPDYAADHAGGLDQHWLWGTLRENSGTYIQVLLASLLINSFALTSPVFIMNFYNRVLPNNAVETGWVLALGAMIVFAFDFIIRTLRAYFIDVAGRRSDVIVAQRLYNQVLDMQLGQRPGSSTGAFANSMREFDALREFFNSATMTGLVDFPFSLLFLLAIWFIGGTQVALVLVALYAAVMLAGWVLQLPVRRRVQQAMKTGEQKHGLLVETIANIETIRGVGGEGALRESYSHYVGLSAEAGQDSRFYSGLSVHFSILVQQLSGVFIVLVGMYLVAAHDMSVGALIACVLLSSRALAPIGQVAGLVNRYHQAKSAYRTLNDIMQLPVERPRDKKFLHRPRLNGGIQFRAVDFSYPRTSLQVLQGLNLTVQPGDKIAVVGRIGSGKSTLVKLVIGFFAPTAGSLLLDDTDIRQIDPADLRRNVAYMGQDTALMSGTIRANITMGRPSATDEDVLRVAELAGVNDFIRRHPLGYDAPVGERGEGLSGGQRQAVALARTLLMDTPVLVMDEPTNSMDSATEERVLQGLEKYTADKTLLVVTHKPALLRLVSRIIVMDGGRIAMDGPREQVLAALAAGRINVQQG
ncbi:MAG: type I secretion system permease/ATPase [Micavibrio sp.]|nr:type I secretion system permease/ATPase [Micavibrio sp.]